MQSKEAFIMPWGSCSMLLFCLGSSSPQTKPKLREVRALMSRKWRGSWPHISAPSNFQHAAMSASGPEPNVGAEPLAQAVPGRAVLSPQSLPRLSSLIPGYEATHVGLLPTHQHNPCLCGVMTHREAVIVMAGCNFGDISYTDMTWTFFLKK